MFTKLSRDDMLNELAVIQGYLDKFKNLSISKKSIEELEEHKQELIDSIHTMDSKRD